ncbi:MAG: hypothetical protein CMJ78_19330 [Planctomycetaceae bacterium]|nr:hypothetical protein [Planctomycetaceae bacterium]
MQNLRLSGLIAVCLISGLLSQADAQERVANRVGAGSKNHKLVPVLKLAKIAEAKLSDTKDYTATFTKRERIGDDLTSQRMELKLREKPFSVHIKFVQPHEGRQVIYVDGRNDGHMIVRGAGIEAVVGTIKLLPTSNRAMEESRYPVSMIGVRKMMTKVIQQWTSELKYDDIDVKFYPNARIGNVQCKVLQTSHSQNKKHFRFHMTRLYLDKSTNFPIRLEQYGFPKKAGEKPVLMEEYTYTNVRPNRGLKDMDFSEKNPAYGF